MVNAHGSEMRSKAMIGSARRLIAGLAGTVLMSGALVTLMVSTSADADSPATAGGASAPTVASGSGTAALPSTLGAGGTLMTNQQLRSSNAQYRLLMQADGNLVEYLRGGFPLWQTGTAGNPGAWLAMQGDGNLVLYSGAGVPLWASGTSGHPGSFLSLQVDANLVVYAPDGVPTWASHTVSDQLPPGAVLTPGQFLTSANGQYRLSVLEDGNVVETAMGRAVWDTGTSGHTEARLTMQDDGNLVVSAAKGVVLWSSGTSGHPGAHLLLQSDGNLVIDAADGSPIWSNGVLAHGLFMGQQLFAGQYLSSTNRAYQLVMQTDGNLVEYRGGSAVWATSTFGHPGTWLTMQTDGNLVLYGPGNVPLWATGTSGNRGARLLLDNDGTLEVTTRQRVVLWTNGGATDCTSTNTCSPVSFTVLLLREPGIAAPVTAPNLYAVQIWERAEGGGAGCPGQPPDTAPWEYSPGPAGNPLDTTQSDAGSQSQPWNQGGVQQFQDASGHSCWYWGLFATNQTLVAGPYGPILTALRNPAPTDHAQCVALSKAEQQTPWGTGDFSVDCKG